MIAYPWSVLGYFVIGILGAAAFLVISLLFDKNVAILENRVIPNKRMMSAIYIIFGGILAAVMNVAANPEFGPNQYPLAFAAGMGWPAIAAGIGAGKRVGEIDEKARELTKEKADSAFATFDAQIEKVKKYYEDRLEEALGSHKTLVDRVSRNSDKSASDFRTRPSSTGGAPR